MERKVFRSRISVFIIGLCFVGYSFLIPDAIRLFHDKMYTTLCMAWSPLLVILFIFLGFRYVILGDRLYFKMWFIPNGSIKISDIISVERTYNPLSSPAGSLKRLCLRLVNEEFSYLLVSPVREQEFIEALKSINPLIDIHIPVKKGIWRFWDWDI